MGTESLIDQIHRAAYEVGGNRTGVRVNLDRVRARFASVPRGELDEALRALHRSGQGSLFHNDGGIGTSTGPTAAEQAAAIPIGGTPHHMIYIQYAPRARPVEVEVMANAVLPRAVKAPAKMSAVVRKQKPKAAAAPATKRESTRLSVAMAKMAKDCGRAVARLKKPAPKVRSAKPRAAKRQGISRRKP